MSATRGGNGIANTVSKPIAIDARHLKTGIGAYTKHLIQSLNELKYGPLHLITRSEYEGELAPYCEQLSVVESPIYSISEQITLPSAAKGCRVLHVPHYNAPLLYRGNLLLTIHDITHVLFPEYRRSWKSRLYAIPMLQLAARQAAHIFTVSEYSKRMLIEKLKLDQDKITVVYNGVGRQFFPQNSTDARAAVAKRYNIRNHYIIYVGSLKRHKNIDTLIKGYAGIRSGQQPELDLVIVGAGSTGRVELENLATSFGVRPVFISDADNDQLANLYRGADVLVLPSFEEGFGLPIVEAMACGTPVVCARAASLPEIAGDSALFFDPFDVQDLCRVLMDVLSSADLRQSLREKGLHRALQFTWLQTASRHIPIYDRFRDA